MFFAGGGKDWLLYQKVAYLNAKRADPTCIVTFPAMTYPNVEGYLFLHGLKAPTPNPSQSAFFADYLAEAAHDPEAAAHHDYFDIMAQHSYSRAAGVWDAVETDKRMMRDAGIDRPIWITEMGIPVHRGTFGASTEQECCDYELQADCYAKAAGAARVFHFQLDNTNGWGIYAHVPNKPKPLFFVYKDVIAPFIAPAAFVKQAHGRAGSGVMEGGDIFQYSIVTGYDDFLLQLPDKRQVHILWADGPESPTVKVPATAASATWIHFDPAQPDSDAHPRMIRETITPSAGSYALKLDANLHTHGWPTRPGLSRLGKPEYSIGGPAQLLIKPALP